MKLGKDVLLEIVAIVQEGLAGGTDVSQALRDLDLTAWPTDSMYAFTDGEVKLTADSAVVRGRHTEEK